MKLKEFLKELSTNIFFCSRLRKSSQERLEGGIFNYEFEFFLENNTKLKINATDNLDLYKCTFLKMDDTQIYESYTFEPIKEITEYLDMNLKI